MAVYRDVSDPTILVTCDQCPHWFSMRFDMVEAYRAGETHEINVHDIEPARARNARVKFERRLAARV